MAASRSRACPRLLRPSKRPFFRSGKSKSVDFLSFAASFLKKSFLSNEFSLACSLELLLSLCFILHFVLPFFSSPSKGKNDAPLSPSVQHVRLARGIHSSASCSNWNAIQHREQEELQLTDLPRRSIYSPRRRRFNFSFLFSSCLLHRRPQGPRLRARPVPRRQQRQLLGLPAAREARVFRTRSACPSRRPRRREERSRCRGWF